MFDLRKIALPIVYALVFAGGLVCSVSCMGQDNRRLVIPSSEDYGVREDFGAGRVKALVDRIRREVEDRLNGDVGASPRARLLEAPPDIGYQAIGYTRELFNSGRHVPVPDDFVVVHGDIADGPLAITEREGTLEDILYLLEEELNLRENKKWWERGGEGFCCTIWVAAAGVFFFIIGEVVGLGLDLSITSVVASSVNMTNPDTKGNVVGASFIVGSVVTMFSCLFGICMGFVGGCGCVKRIKSGHVRRRRELNGNWRAAARGD